GDHALAVVGERDVQRGVGQAGLQWLGRFGVGGPDLGLVVAPAGGNAAVVGEGQRRHAAAVRGLALGLSAVVHVPELDCAVLAGAGQDVAVVAEGQIGDRVLVAT